MQSGQDERRGDSGWTRHECAPRREEQQPDHHRRERDPRGHARVLGGADPLRELREVCVPAGTDVGAAADRGRDVGGGDEPVDPRRVGAQGPAPPRPYHGDRVQRRAGRVDPERRRARPAGEP